MNHSFYSADRMTHLKIVIIALVAATTAAGVGIASHLSSDNNVQAQVIRAGKPVVLTSSANSLMR